MLLPRQFNANEHEKMGDFSAIPAEDCGDKEYIAQIIKSELNKNSAGSKDPNGSNIKLTLKILQGKYKGRLLWTQLNIINKNPTAVEIANKELATIATAVGVPHVKDTDQLHGKPMKIKIRYKPGDSNWPPKNEIAYYMPLDAGTKVEAEPVQNQSDSSSESQPQQEANKPKKPWE